MLKKIQQSKNATGTERSIYLMYLFGQNIAFQITLVLLNLYWLQTLLIAPLVVSGIMLAARIWDAVNDPMLGGIVQRVGKNRFGLYKPWTLGASFVLPILIFAMFAAPFGTGATNVGTAIWAGLSYILFGMVYTVTDIPIFSLSMTMEPDTKRRVKLLFFGRLGAGAAGIVASLIFFGVLDSTAVDGAYTLSGYLLAGGIAAIIALITMVPIFMVNERNIKVRTGDKIGLKDMAKSVGRNKHLLKVLLFNAISSIFAMSFMMGLPFFASMLVSDGNTTLIMALSGVFALSISFALMFLLNKLGAKKTIFLFEVVGLIWLIAFGVITYYVRLQWALILMTIGANMVAQTPMTVMMGKLVQETIEYGHYHNGQRQEAVGFAAQTFSVKFTMGISGFIIPAILGAVGLAGAKAETVDPTVAINSYLWVVIGLLSFSSLAAMITFGILYNLRTKQVEIMAKANLGEISHEEAETRLEALQKNKVSAKRE